MREMKDSGVEWIGIIPENWNIARLKDLAKIQTGSTPDRNQQNIYFSNKYGVPWIKAENLGYLESICNVKEYLTPEGAKIGRIFPENTVFVCCIASVGKVGFSNQISSCNQQINALIFNKNIINWKYGFYLSISQEEEYNLKASGNVMKIINSEKQSYIMCTIPPISEQQKIATYLDTQCSKVDTLIANQQSQIEKLKSYKQSLITEVVTKGLDKNVPMKDSEVEWIGKIPEHWIIIKSKYCVSINHGTDPKTDGDIPVYGSGAESFKTCGEYKEGPCVLIGRKGATLHIPHYIQGKYWNVDTAFDVKVNNENISLKFYYYCATSFDYKFFMSQTTLPGMTQTSYMNMFLPLPPIIEQNQIVKYLDAQLLIIDNLIAVKQNKIEKLQQYKKSLIYEYVTGKKEVK